MRLVLSLSKTTEPLRFKTDNPGGKWLEEEREYNQSKGLNRFGCPARFGAITGYFNRHVLLPVSVLAKLRGLSGEQDAVRSDSLEWLKKHMAQHKRLPLYDEKHYVPYVMVWQNGVPYVNEGNHRIMAAAQLGFKYLPVELRYFGGGEEIRTGILNPEEVAEFDATAHRSQHTLTDYLK